MYVFWIKTNIRAIWDSKIRGPMVEIWFSKEHFWGNNLLFRILKDKPKYIGDLSLFRIKQEENHF